MSPGTYIGDGEMEKKRESVILKCKQILSKEYKKDLYVY